MVTFAQMEIDREISAEIDEFGRTLGEEGKSLRRLVGEYTPFERKSNVRIRRRGSGRTTIFN